MIIKLEDKKWMNHNEIAGCPIDLNLFLLYDKKYPIKIPIERVMIIKYLKKLGNKNIDWIGLIIHENNDPKIIDIGIINIIDKLE